MVFLNPPPSHSCECNCAARLREENARLTQQVNLLTVRRDQLMAEVERIKAVGVRRLLEAEAEVGKAKAEVALCYETLEEQREVNHKAWAEVARLEGLILDWSRELGLDAELEAEARRIRAQHEEGK